MNREPIDFGLGVTAVPATQADMDALNADMRDLDRQEAELLGDGKEHLECFERAWAIRENGRLAGIAGFKPFAGSSAFSTARLFLWMSTNHIWKVKKTFLRISPKVAAFIASQMPPWVTDLYSCPVASYSGSIKWQTKVLRFRHLRNIDWYGVKVAILHRPRKES